MARPTGVRVRSYNVGFGDCFLVSFTYAGGDRRHLLIDFGSTRLPPRARADHLERIAERIRADTGGKLHVVVATHRHADHICGFAGAPGAVIAALEPELVVQPWTEDPGLAPDATAPTAAARDDGSHALVARLADMQAVAAAVVSELPALEGSPSVRRTVRVQLGFLGETNLPNREAVEHLMALGRRPAVYASFGTKLPIRDLLPGVKVDVLGPPTLEQSRAIAGQRSRDADEFWQLAAASAEAHTGAGGRPAPLFGDLAIAVADVPQEARWVIPEIDRLRSEELLSLVRILDATLNNTSLILLFEVGGTRLVFGGDAQIENWSYALSAARNRKAIARKLASARLYKVGHHGSRNATPKTLWRLFEHRGPAGTPQRVATLVSTLPGTHGSVARGTEVPRRTLMAALAAESELHSTDALPAQTVWTDVELAL
jgi:hypothetical protein